MSHRASDDFPRHVLQHIANGKSLAEALDKERGERTYLSAQGHFQDRRRRQGYRTTFEMLASYVAEGIVLVDKRPAF